MTTKEATTTSLDPATQRHLERAAAAVAGDFTGIFSRETVEQMLTESAQRLGGEARFADYLPVLAHRFARERLVAVAHAAGTLEQELPSVLFVYVQNAGRSQMARRALVAPRGRSRHSAHRGQRACRRGAPRGRRGTCARSATRSRRGSSASSTTW